MLQNISKMKTTSIIHSYLVSGYCTYVKYIDKNIYNVYKTSSCKYHYLIIYTYILNLYISKSL